MGSLTCELRMLIRLVGLAFIVKWSKILVLQLRDTLLNLELKGVEDMNHKEEVILVIVMVAVGLLLVACLVLNFNWKYCCKDGKNKHSKAIGTHGDGHISISSTDGSVRNAPNLV
ncbi:hypothetical protein OsJ_02904 [Oryza sativa Japonica Group]|uniref:Uncharacterized protein n=2 Tax=Oryza TaxID=4527 RepID=A2ZW87_ORYSJ|nr:hypothetical protein OsJ_02904 [Oryza sativa Japonica Group]